VVETTLGDDLSLIQTTIAAIRSAPGYLASSTPTQGDIMEFLGVSVSRKNAVKRSSKKARKGFNQGSISVSAGDVICFAVVVVVI
jgi:hypothetical protein